MRGQPLSQPFLRRTFFLIFLLLFLMINLGYYYFLVFSLELPALLYAWLLEFAAFGLAYESTVVILTLVLGEVGIPFLRKLREYPPVALVCVTCDDVDLRILKALGRQTYPSLQVFILDDSQHQESRSAIDSLPFPVIRRDRRDGYKAGNLNHWLFPYGASFSYFVVADADSIFSDTFVEQMVAYAEHPDNQNIAVFESLLEGWNGGNEFVHLQSVTRPIDHRQCTRLDNRLGSTFSVGHNNLYRTSAIMSIGGFSKDYLAEDYATTMELLRRGNWLCKTVPVLSYERLPANLAEYARRHARWAFQTLQLLSTSSSGVPWCMRLKILKAVHMYLTPIVVILGTLLLLVFNVRYWLLYPSDVVTLDAVSMFLRSRVFIFWLIYLLLPLSLWAILLFRERIAFIQYIRSVLFRSAVFFSTIWPVAHRLAVFWHTNSRTFDVTGTAPCPSLRGVLRLAGPPLVMIWIALASTVLNGVSASLNLMWLLPASLSPFLVCRYQKSDPAVKGNGKISVLSQN